MGLIAGAVIGGTVAGVLATNSGETGWALVGSMRKAHYMVGLLVALGAQNAKGLADAILKNTSATATGMISGIRSLTGNTAFSNVVSQQFILATGRINIMTVINSAVMSFRNFYLVD